MLIFKNTKDETIITTVDKIDNFICDEEEKYYVSISNIFYEIEKEEFYKLKIALKNYSNLKEKVMWNLNKLNIKEI